MLKYVVIQCAEAYHHELEAIFNEIHINSYSEIPVNGFMKGADGTTDISNWFASSNIPTAILCLVRFWKKIKLMNYWIE